MSAEDAMLENGSGNGPLLSQMRRAWIFLMLLGFGLGMTGVWMLQPAPEPTTSSITLAPLERSDKPRRMSTQTVASLEAKFSRLGYDLSEIRTSASDVPPVLGIWIKTYLRPSDRIMTGP